MGFVAREPIDLGLAVHGVPEFEARALLELARVKDPLEQQNGATPAQIAQALRFTHFKHTKAIGASQTLVYSLDPVAIGIGFDHGQDLGGRTQGLDAG